MLGFAVPALVRKDKKEKVGLTASHISEVGPTHLSSRRDISSATSPEKTSMEVDQGKVVGSIGEKREVGRLLPERRDLWTSRVGFEPPYYAVLYFESSMSTPLLRQGGAAELRSPILPYCRSISICLSTAEPNFYSLITKFTNSGLHPGQA